MNLWTCSRYFILAQDPTLLEKLWICLDEGPDNRWSMVPCLNEMVYRGAVLVTPSVTVAMEIDLGHILPPPSAFLHEA